MAHSSIPLTLAPCLSRLSYVATPFLSQVGETGYLVLDIRMNHVEIEFREKAPGDRAFMIDHNAGRICLEMPPLLSGVMADQVLFDERGMDSLKYLAFAADHTDSGLAVCSPKEYQQHLAFLVGRARDYAELGAEIEVDAMSMSMSQLGVIGVTPSGAVARKFSAAITFKDRETGRDLDGQEALDEAIEIRCRAGQAHGVLVRGLDDRLRELVEVAMSAGACRAEDEIISTLRRAGRGSGTYSSFLKQLSADIGSFEFEYGHEVFEATLLTERQVHISERMAATIAFSASAYRDACTELSGDALSSCNKVLAAQPQPLTKGIGWGSERSHVSHGRAVALRVGKRATARACPARQLWPGTLLNKHCFTSMYRSPWAAAGLSAAPESLPGRCSWGAAASSLRRGVTHSGPGPPTLKPRGIY